MKKSCLSTNICNLNVYYRVVCYLGLCFLYCFTYEVQAQEKSFESLCEKEKSIITWNKRKIENNITCLRTSQNSEIHYYNISPSLTMLSWQVIDSIRHTNLTITLYNSNYYFKGIFNNQPYDKTVKSKGYPWHQNIAYSAGKILINKKSFTYECFRPDNLELYVMQAERKNNLTVFNNQNAYEVKVRLTGLLSHFWSCLYYFNAENHQFIGYKGVNGGPGTPETIIKSK